MLMADVSKGAHATAKRLDRPTELKMRDRQMLWTDTAALVAELNALGLALDAAAAHRPKGKRSEIAKKAAAATPHGRQPQKANA